MTQMEQTSTAYERFVEAHSLYLGREAEQIRAEIQPDEFERQVRQLHGQWLSGAFSFGKFTEIIGVAHAELWDILDILGLTLHR